MDDLIIHENFPLQQLTTFHLNVNARFYCEISTRAELRSLLESRHFRENRTIMMGGGSNLLFRSDFDGLVIRIRNKGIRVAEQGDGYAVVKASAGENWHEFVTWCVNKGFGGLENLSLIPGNVGSCPIQNIGAYGAEVKDTLASLEAIDLQTGETRIFGNEECGFGYRESVFKNSLKGRYLIWSVSFRLSTRPALQLDYGAIRQELEAMGAANPGIADVSRAVSNIRRSKLPDPDVIGNAGSFFKNPTVNQAFAERLKAKFPNLISYPQGGDKVKLAAGWLIEQCGWKGYREGDAGVHASQALVLVNYGNASGADILALAAKIQQSVYERFGVELLTEVNVI